MNATVNLCDTALAQVMDLEDLDKPVHPALAHANEMVAGGDYQLSTEEKHLRAVALRKHPELRDGCYHYVAMDDLPEPGRIDAPYKVTTTGDLFMYTDGQYVAFNPYAEESKQLAQPRIEIVDNTANLPTGGTGPLAVVYNVHALRYDLYLKGVRDWSYADMMPSGERWRIQPHTSLAEQRNLYFRFSHRALADQLRTHVRHRGEFKKDYVSALERIGVEIWFENGKFGFKDGEFVVVFE